MGPPPVRGADSGPLSLPACIILLIAALSTVGIFLQVRTANLAEIQLRLATLEDLLQERGGAPR
jgi:hypothetical protein